MKITHLLGLDVIGNFPDIEISEQEYLNVKASTPRIYAAFEIELAFDFVVTNYVEIEKYVAEHLVLDMVGSLNSVDAFRAQQWGFIRTLNNWLSSISLWKDIARGRLITICGRGSELEAFDAAEIEFRTQEFEFELVFHLRNFSQHGGFPLTSSTSGARWNDERTELSFSAGYKLDYNAIRPYFEAGGKGGKARKAFGKRIEEYCGGEPFDLKPVIRKSMGQLGAFMDRIRNVLSGPVEKSQSTILDLISKYKSAHPEISIIGLSVMPADEQKVVEDRNDIISVRDEFIVRTKELQKKNNGNSLKMERRTITNL